MDTCSHCQRPQTKAGHDPCIADLPGVSFACCGHGGKDAFTQGWSTPYIVEPEGQTLYGYRALARMRELGGDPPEVDLDKLFEQFGLKKLSYDWVRESLVRADA